MKHILVLISVLLFYNVQSQNISEVYSKATTSFKNQDYKTAILDFKRVVYFDSLFKTDSISEYIAHSYYAIGDYSNALFYYSKNETNNKLHKAACYLLTNQYEMANMELNLFAPNTNETILDFYVLKTCYALQLDYVDTAQYYIQKIYAFTQDSSLHVLQSEFTRYQKLSSKSLLLPQISCAIIPGLGHVIIGNFKEGIRSFVLVSTLAIAFTATGFSYSFPDAIISIGPWLIRYYIGQIKNIKKYRQKEIEDLRYSIFIQMMHSYESNHTVSKKSLLSDKNN